MGGVNRGFLRRLAFLSVAAVLVFAVVFTVGDAMGFWPEAPSPVFRNADLAAGFLFAAAMIAAAVRSLRRRSPAPPPSPDSN